MIYVTSSSGVHANARPYLHGPELDAVAAALSSGQYGHGRETELFEQELAAFLGVPDVVAVATGTAALHLALLVAGVGPGDDVVVPSLTFAATVQAITATGARPRFADIDPGTLCKSAQDLREAWTPATRAVVPVLYGGRAVDLTPLRAELEDRDVTVVEDAAHAFGSYQGTRRVGSTGTLTCFSFDAIKSLTCGDGGAIVPRSGQDAAALRRMRLLGLTDCLASRGATVSYGVQGPGWRYHLSTLHAAIGRVQLQYFGRTHTRRRQLWRAYRDALQGLPGATLVDVDCSTPFNCVVRIPARDQVHALLRAQDIAVGVHYPPNHLQAAFAPWRRTLPATERSAAEILSLPFHPDMTQHDVDQVVAALASALLATGASGSTEQAPVCPLLGS